MTTAAKSNFGHLPDCFHWGSSSFHSSAPFLQLIIYLNGCELKGLSHIHATFIKIEFLNYVYTPFIPGFYVYYAQLVFLFSNQRHYFVFTYSWIALVGKIEDDLLVRVRKSHNLSCTDTLHYCAWTPFLRTNLCLSINIYLIENIDHPRSSTLWLL